MGLILDWVNGLSSFQQSILGSFIFAVTSWIAQAAFKKAKSRGADFWAAYSKLDVVKHSLHKEYVNSNNIQLASFGARFAVLHALRWVLRAALIMVFFFGINSIVNREWFLIAAVWFTFNCLLEAWNWVKDSSSPKHIEHVPKDVASEIIESLKPKLNSPH